MKKVDVIEEEMKKENAAPPRLSSHDRWLVSMNADALLLQQSGGKPVLRPPELSIDPLVDDAFKIALRAKKRNKKGK